MDIESIGSGFGTGLIGTILGILGITRKVNRLDDCKQDKTVCDSIHKGINDKFDTLIKGQDRIWERLDRLNDYIRNGK